MDKEGESRLVWRVAVGEIVVWTLNREEKACPRLHNKVLADVVAGVLGSGL